jgi:hypothetical protein
MLADSNQDRSAPRHPIDPARDPFVGNLSVDDNIREGVRVAIWSAIGDRAREIAAEITDGVVTVAGHYIDDAERAAVHRAIIAVPGVRRIVDRAVPEVADESAAAPVVTYEATPLLQVVRYCGLDDASTAAAIRQAVAELDGVVAALGLEAPDTLIVRYRAPVRDAITLEIGFATVAELAERGHGEVSGSQIPAGPRTHRPIAAGMAGLIAGVSDLSARGALAIWQELPASAFRPWTGHDAGELLAVLPAAEMHKSLRPGGRT